MSTIAQLLVKVTSEGITETVSATNKLTEADKLLVAQLRSGDKDAKASAAARTQVARDEAAEIKKTEDEIVSSMRERNRVDLANAAARTQAARIVANEIKAAAAQESAAMSAVTERNTALAAVWNAGERSKTQAEREHVAAVRSEQAALYASLKQASDARLTLNRQLLESVKREEAEMIRLQATQRQQAASHIADLNTQIQLEHQLAASGGRITSSGAMVTPIVTPDSSSVGQSSALISALKTQVMGLAAAYVSVQGAVRLFNETISSAAGYQTLERQLEFLTGGGVAAATKELGYLTDVSNRYGTVLLQSTESYSALASAMKLSGVSMQGVHQTYEALSSVAATYALSQDKVNAIMLAFTQIAGKGRVQSEELVRQLGQYIPALQLGAQAMGMSIRDFNKALKEGTVSSAEFLPKFSALIQAMYGKDLENKTNTITAAQNRFKTALQATLNELGNSSGAVAVYKAGVQALTNQLNAFSGASLTDAIRNVTALGERLNAIKASGTSSWFMSNFGTKEQWRVVQEESEKFYIAQSQLKARLAGASSSEIRASIDALDKSLSPLYDRLETAQRLSRSGVFTMDNGEMTGAAETTSKVAIERGIAIRKQLEDAFYTAVKKEGIDTATEVAVAWEKQMTEAFNASESALKSFNQKAAESNRSPREKSIPEWVNAAYLSAQKDLSDAMVAFNKDGTESASDWYNQSLATFTAVSQQRDKYYSEYDDNLKAQTEALRISTLDEESQIAAKYQLQIQAAEKAYGSNKEGLAEYEKWAWAAYDQDIAKFRASEQSKTDELQRQLLKRYGKYTPAGVTAEYDQQRAVVNGIKEDKLPKDQRAAAMSGIDVAENKAQLSAIQDSYKNENDILQLQLDQRKITEEDYQKLSIENWKKYQDDMENTAGGAKVVQQENLQGWSQITSGMQNNMSEVESLTKRGTAANKAAYLASRALAVAGILINTELSAAQAEAQSGNVFLGMTLAQWVRAEGYASAALTAAMIPAGYATGGYTGDGGKYEPRGVVHAGEVVWTQEDVRAAGGAAMAERIRNNMGAGGGTRLTWTGNSYATGGYVAPTPTVNASSNVSVPIQINNNSDSTVTAKTQTINGQTIVQIAVAQAKAELYNDIASWNGPMANALSAQGVRRG